MGGFRDPAVAERWQALQHAHPARVEQLELLLTVIERASPRRVLDVGVGSGLVAEAVLDSVPEATLVGVDSRRRCSPLHNRGSSALVRELSS